MKPNGVNFARKKHARIVPEPGQTEENTEERVNKVLKFCLLVRINLPRWKLIIWKSFGVFE